MIRLNVFIRTTESNREELVRTAKELAAASLKDEGCVAYDLFESSTRNDGQMICETGSDANALAAHEHASQRRLRRFFVYSSIASKSDL